MPRPSKAGWMGGRRRGFRCCLPDVFRWLVLAVGVWSGASIVPVALGAPVIRLPDGFACAVFTDEVPYARTLARGPSGTWFVGTKKDRVYLVRDRDADFKADAVQVLLSGLNRPNGVTYRNGDLFVAEIHRVLRYRNIMAHIANPPEPEVVARYPKNTWHGLKVIRFGPDGLLYVPVGSPCNVCETFGTPFGRFTTLDVETNVVRPFAQGVRNSVGFDWHPRTRELWFTDNGRDHLGDDLPPDELNHAPKAGLHFGFPYRHGTGLVDPEFGDRAPALAFVPCAQPLGPHVASLGMRFYAGTQFPRPYRNQIFICEHGSWNRSEKIGYRLTLVRLEGNTPVSYEPFATGWLHDGKVSGRPVDVEMMEDGSLLISDDHAGALYRIAWKGIE